ncbi:MAG: hypothetical protein JW876_02255 [Candidatus Krumholzibacteriota bacterium]|nr:hypothetical protein [Candidatus Krumholzibacteriota bacterium]
MTGPRIRRVAAVIAALVVIAGCGRDTGSLDPAPISTDPVVFTDAFGQGVDFQAFLNSKLDALQTTTTTIHSGTTALEVTVPGPDDPSGWFAGGAFVANVPRDFSGYDALTFWARASKSPAVLNTAGIANDNTGTSIYEASVNNLSLTTTWTKYIIPIPLPAKLAMEKGLFFFAEGYESDNVSYQIWFDDIVYEKTGLVSNPRPVLDPGAASAFVGATVDISGTSVTFDVDGTDVTVEHLPGYFSFASSNDTVAQVVDGNIVVVGPGTATITAALGNVPASGAVTLTANPAPTTPAPVPTIPADDVISLFSDVYDDITVDSWSADWPDQADVADFAIAGNPVKAYTNLVYAGILFETVLVDAADMDFFHIDVWAPPGTSAIKVKLVDFGEDGVYGGAPDSQKELTFTGASVPPFTAGAWVGLDIPLADFMGPTGLQSREHLAQLLISGANITAFIDNVFFYRLPGGAGR